MGVSRYSRNPAERRRQELFDHLQTRCGWNDDLTIGELRAAGVVKAHLVCRKFECMHNGDAFDLAKFGGKLLVRRLRWQYVCGRCGTKGPILRLSQEGYSTL